MSWPAKYQAQKCEEPVISLDIMPTIADILGVKLPTDRVYDGKSMLPVLNGKQKDPLHEFLCFDGNAGHWSIRKGKWKVVKPKKGDIELYDLQKDVGETNNLAQAHQELVKQLTEAYQDWRANMGTPMGK